MEDREAGREDGAERWASIADRACRRLAVIALALLALLLAAQTIMHDDGLRRRLSPTERLEGVPYDRR